MNKNHSPFAIIEIGSGIICLLLGVIGFVKEGEIIMPLHIIFLGFGLLLYGLTNNNADKSERGKMLSNIASIFLIVASILFFYNYFYGSK